MALTLTVNGTPRRFEGLTPGASILQLLEALELKGDRIALEVNGDITHRASWALRILADDDKIELVHFVGGGTNNSRKA